MERIDKYLSKFLSHGLDLVLDRLYLLGQLRSFLVHGLVRIGFSPVLSSLCRGILLFRRQLARVVGGLSWLPLSWFRFWVNPTASFRLLNKIG